jgi:hypothetical protein
MSTVGDQILADRTRGRPWRCLWAWARWAIAASGVTTPSRRSPGPSSWVVPRWERRLARLDHGGVGSAVAGTRGRSRAAFNCTAAVSVFVAVPSAPFRESTGDDERDQHQPVDDQSTGAPRFGLCAARATGSADGTGLVCRQERGRDSLFIQGLSALAPATASSKGLGGRRLRRGYRRGTTTAAVMTGATTTAGSRTSIHPEAAPSRGD